MIPSFISVRVRITNWCKQIIIKCATIHDRQAERVFGFCNMVIIVSLYVERLVWITVNVEAGGDETKKKPLLLALDRECIRTVVFLSEHLLYLHLVNY